MTTRILCLAVFFLNSIQLNATTVEALGGPFSIPDDDPVGINIQFDFSGFDEEVIDLSLNLQVQHTWMADISATLTSPNGEAQLVIFSRVGTGKNSEFGDSSDLNGTYSFTDVGDDMWLTAADLGDNEALPSGTYRTSTAGQPNLSNYGGHRTSLTGVFGDLISGSDGVSGDGIWVLNISDQATGDTGTVTSASLTLNAPEIIFNNGFEGTDSTVPLPRNRMDFNGNGLADYGVLITNDPLVQSWRILDNEGDGTTGAELNFDLGLGISENTWSSADFDGDGIADAIAWDNANAQYSIRRSSRPGSAPLNLLIGTTDDEVRALMGDYDGDGIDDPVTFTNTGAIGEQRVLHYVRSSDSTPVSTLMGLDEGADSIVLGGEDFTGDGRADLLLVTGEDYVIRDGQTGAIADTFSFGPGSVGRIIIGNFSGDNRPDVTRITVNAGNIFWETRETGPGTISPTVELGTINLAGFSEFAAQGDYDGDGYQDYGVWRRDNATNDSAQFIFIPSTDPASTTTVTFGSMEETPVVIGQSKI